MNELILLTGTPIGEYPSGGKLSPDTADPNGPAPKLGIISVNWFAPAGAGPAIPLTAAAYPRVVELPPIAVRLTPLPSASVTEKSALARPWAGEITGNVSSAEPIMNVVVEAPAATEKFRFTIGSLTYSMDDPGPPAGFSMPSSVPS